MKYFLNIGVVVLLSVAITCGAVAQDGSGGLTSADADTSKSQAQTAEESERIVIPVYDPNWYYTYTTDEPAQLIQTGVYIDRYGIGGEFALSLVEHGLYGRVFAGSMVNPSHEALLNTNNNTAWAGLTVGLETILHSFTGGSSNSDDLIRTDIDRLQFYGRAGPGIGITTATKNSRGSFGTHFGMHAEMTVGVRLRLFEQTAIYIETGALAGYFPAASEMSLIGTPQLKIGFSFFRNQGIPPYRF